MSDNDAIDPHHKKTPKAIERGCQFLEGYFQRQGLTVKMIGERSSNKEFVYNLTGQIKELKRRPDLLSALTRLTQLATNVGAKKHVSCVIDLEGHLGARKALLEVIAADAADVSRHTGKRAIIEGLSSYERRQIHGHLTDEESVETLSEGEGEYRYLMVSKKS